MRFRSLLSCIAAVAMVLTLPPTTVRAAEHWSGIYPHLAMFNDDNECGTGAVVPWADRLWVVTYAPHRPAGSSDKLYEIDPALTQTIRPESIGGTPANRMIHRESGQLFIGPYAIDGQRQVRAIPYTRMFGRPTGNARHLHDPAGKIYYATMEEGIYEVDVKTLAVTELWADDQAKSGRKADLPGYHGKGFYSGFGRMIYSNNGEHGKAALEDPDTTSGVLTTWDGKADAWTLVRRSQFTDVTGPSGILGNAQPDQDPIWTIGWDARSLLLMTLHGGTWHTFRLPKASHAYDGAHGWNTEWPRIREIGEKDLLMTMHGMFWRFPPDFRPGHTAGLAPRSSYLKVVGDFCRWNDRIILGCDDAAKSEFLNVSRVKGEIAGPGQSQSNLVFLEPAQLDRFGPAAGRGAVWQRENVEAGIPSDPFLFAGFARRGLHLRHEAAEPAVFHLETDAGDGKWRPLRTITVPPGHLAWTSFSPEEQGAWIRLIADRAVPGVSAIFAYTADDVRTAEAAPIFAGLARAETQDYLGGLLRARGENLRTLAVGAVEVAQGAAHSKGFYELDADLVLHARQDPAALQFLEKSVPVKSDAVQRDAASTWVVDDDGRRWRLPQQAAYAAQGSVALRVAREVVTERNLLNVDGTFYELPARNAGGLARLRPIATHGRRITDFASYRGLMVMTGIDPNAGGHNRHIIRSADGKAAVWVGSIDDLWAFGKPVGRGGPWLRTAVQKDEPSDPYLCNGYDRKTLMLAHDASCPATFRVEVDPTGAGDWGLYESFPVASGETFTHQFPPGYSAAWLRVGVDTACAATAQLHYE